LKRSNDEYHVTTINTGGGGEFPEMVCSHILYPRFRLEAGKVT
jgi:hypothetical protein